MTKTFQYMSYCIIGNAPEMFSKSLYKMCPSAFCVSYYCDYYWLLSIVSYCSHSLPDCELINICEHIHDHHNTIHNFFYQVVTLVRSDRSPTISTENLESHAIHLHHHTDTAWDRDPATRKVHQSCSVDRCRGRSSLQGRWMAACRQLGHCPVWKRIVFINTTHPR